MRAHGILKPRTMMSILGGRIEAIKVTANYRPSSFICGKFIKDHELSNKWDRARLNTLLGHFQELLRGIRSSSSSFQINQVVFSTKYLAEGNPVGISQGHRSAFIDMAQDAAEIECAPVLISHSLISPASLPSSFSSRSIKKINSRINSMIYFYQNERMIDLKKQIFRGMHGLSNEISIENTIQLMFARAVIEQCAQLKILKASCQLYPNKDLHLKNFKRVSIHSVAEMKYKISTRGKPKVLLAEKFEDLDMTAWFTVIVLAAFAVIAEKLGDAKYAASLRQLLLGDFGWDLALQEFIELGLDEAGDHDTEAGRCYHFAKIPLLTGLQMEMAKQGFRQMFDFFKGFFDRYYEGL